MPLAQWTIQDAIATEREFFAINGYRGARDGERVYTVLDGKIPVLVSAPHAVKHLRAGVVEPKEEDEYTGTVARLLHALEPSRAMVFVRTREEVEEARRRDPITRFERVLLDLGVLTASDPEQIAAEIKEDVDRQIDEAWNAPDPDPASLERHVFAEGTPQAEDRSP